MGALGRMSGAGRRKESGTMPKAGYFWQHAQIRTIFAYILTRTASIDQRTQRMKPKVKIIRAHAPKIRTTNTLHKKLSRLHQPVLLRYSLKKTTRDARLKAPPRSAFVVQPPQGPGKQHAPRAIVSRHPGVSNTQIRSKNRLASSYFRKSKKLEVERLAAKTTNPRSSAQRARGSF